MTTPSPNPTAKRRPMICMASGCNWCGHDQELSLDMCPNCGSDAVLYVDVGPPIAPPTPKPEWFCFECDWEGEQPAVMGINNPSSYNGYTEVDCCPECQSQDVSRFKDIPKPKPKPEGWGTF